MSKLVTIDPVPEGEAFIEQVSRATRKHAAEWQRILAAPGLARALSAAESDAEARELAARYAGLGFGTHVIDADEIASAIDGVFEAAWAERARDGFICIGADGKELELPSGNVRSLTTGHQIVQGQRQHFLVVGLRGGAAAIVLRFPGSDVSKLVRANSADEEMAGALAAFTRAAPHAHVERGLETLAGKLPCLALVGATDLAHAAVASAALVRRFPPSPPKAAPAAVPSDSAAAAGAGPVGGRYPGEQARGRFGQPVVAAAPLELDVEGGERPRSDASVAMDALDALAPPQGAPTGGRAFEAGTPIVRAASSGPMGRRLMIAGVVAVVVVAMAFVAMRKPSSQQHVVKRGETWQSAYGASFTYSAAYDASISGVTNPGFVIDVARGGDTTSVRMPSHESKVARDVGGASWHVESWDDLGAASGGGADWIVIAIRPN